MKQVAYRFFNNTARIESMFLLAGVLPESSLPEGISEFLFESSQEELEKVFGKINFDLYSAIEQGDSEAIVQWLIDNEKYGFLIQMASPVKTATKVRGCRSFSWGHYRTGWVYGADLDEALDNGFKWVDDMDKKGFNK